MQAVLLAGGLGTRLRSLVNDRPKVMADVAGRPFLELQLERLKSSGIRDVVICAGYLHEMIQRYFGNGSGYGLSIRYSIERELRGTGGALKQAEHLLAPTFLLCNGDTYVDADLEKFQREHHSHTGSDLACLGTIAVSEVRDTRAYGLVMSDRQLRILKFCEKQPKAQSGYASAGVYMLERALLDLIPYSGSVSLEHAVIPQALRAGWHFYASQLQGSFIDLGTPAGYRKIQSRFAKVAT
jgi:NDP-sugar pyrophosphorylase family protein